MALDVGIWTSRACWNSAEEQLQDLNTNPTTSQVGAHQLYQKSNLQRSDSWWCMVHGGLGCPVGKDCETEREARGGQAILFTGINKKLSLGNSLDISALVSSCFKGAADRPQTEEGRQVMDPEPEVFK